MRHPLTRWEVPLPAQKVVAFQVMTTMVPSSTVLSCLLRQVAGCPTSVGMVAECGCPLTLRAGSWS